MTEQEQMNIMSNSISTMRIDDDKQGDYKTMLYGDMTGLDRDEYYDEYMNRQLYSWNNNKGHKGYVKRMNRLTLKKKQIEELEEKRRIQLKTINDEIRRAKIERLVLKHILKNHDEPYINSRREEVDERQR